MIESRAPEKNRRFVYLAAVLATLVFALVFLINLKGTIVQDSSQSSALRLTAQTIVVFVCFGVFFIHWLPPKQPKTLQSIFIATAFLSTGILAFAQTLTCSMILNILESEGPVGSFFHMMTGVTMAASLLFAAYIPSQRGIQKRESYLILLAFLLYTGALVAAAMLFGSYFPSLCPHDANADSTRIVIEVGMIIALLLATAKYYRSGRESKEMLFAYLAVATILASYSHAAFCLHQNPYDAYSMLSTVLTIASFGFVFLALFGISITQPYEKLMRAQEQAERRRKEAEAATVKAQTYLDFLGHDIANMISPIMGRAEMISTSKGASEEQKKEALKIIDQTHKVASLIVNLRRLSRTERIDAGKLGEVDLRVLLPGLENARTRSNPGKNLTVNIRFPEEAQVKILGGSAAEEMIEEVLDNAIKHGGKESIEINIDVHPAHGDLHKRFWDIEIQDHGIGIPDHMKAALNVASSDPEKRFTRGVASSLSIMSLIAEALGGKIRIGDRVPNDHTQGTTVTITLPRAG